MKSAAFAVVLTLVLTLVAGSAIAQDSPYIVETEDGSIPLWFAGSLTIGDERLLLGFNESRFDSTSAWATLASSVTKVTERQSGNRSELHALRPDDDAASALELLRPIVLTDGPKNSLFRGPSEFVRTVGSGPVVHEDLSIELLDWFAGRRQRHSWDPFGYVYSFGPQGWSKTTTERYVQDPNASESLLLSPSAESGRTGAGVSALGMGAIVAAAIGVLATTNQINDLNQAFGDPDTSYLSSTRMAWSVLGLSGLVAMFVTAR